MSDETRPHLSDVRQAIADGIPKAEIARRADVHANTLADVDKPEWNPRWKTLLALCDAIAAIKAERAAA